MIYNAQHQIPIKDLEEYGPVDIIDHAKKQMVVNMALKMYEEGLFNFEIFDPREPISESNYNNPSKIEWEQSLKKNLAAAGLIQITGRIDIKSPDNK